MKKIAVILFNLGGPDSLDSVQPFLFNLFNDPAIIGAPQPIRWMLAQFISRRRKKTAQHIYQEMGGKSPILNETTLQADALQRALNNDPSLEYKPFICMRYWHPRSDEVARNVQQYKPDHIVLLPLYPQFSTTTSGSSIGEWNRQAAKIGISTPTSTVCCYPYETSFIEAHVKHTKESYQKAAKYGKPRILFSAHGLPEKIIEAGDPYQWQVEQTAQAIVGKLAIEGLDWRVTYQSRVGPLAWIGPSTDTEIHKAGEEKIPLVVVPIAFVSEHSETLVELDIEYRELAEQSGVTNYQRVRALTADSDFIASLASTIKNATSKEGIAPCKGMDVCPKEHGACPNRKRMVA